MSATVYNLILAPKDLINSVDKDDFEDEDGKLDQSAYQAEIQRKRDEVADGLCAIRPDLDRADLERRLEKENSQYEVLLTNVEEGGGRVHPGLHRGEQDRLLPLPHPQYEAVLPLLRPGLSGAGLCQHRGGRVRPGGLL